MELRHVEAFVAVAEELSFSRAASKLRIGQPAVSRLVRSLERELEVVLLDRTTHRVSLSQAGRAFLPAAKALVAQVDVAARAAREGLLQPPSVLGIGNRPGLANRGPCPTRAGGRSRPACFR